MRRDDVRERHESSRRSAILGATQRDRRGVSALPKMEVVP